MNGRGQVATARADGAALLGGLVRSFADATALVAKPKQVRAAVATVRRFLWRAGIERPGQITTATVQSYLAGEARAGRSLKTLHNVRSALSGFCRCLVRLGFLPADPCAAIRLRRLPRRLPRYLTPAQSATVLHLADRAGIWPEVALALATGLRLSELIRLAWADVDLAGRIVTVREAKGGRGRTVPLSDLAVAALVRQRQITGGMAQVFPARQTWRGGWRYVDRRRASNWWRRALRPIQAALPVFGQAGPTATGRGWHLFRHTFASRAAQDGVSLYKIAAWMGHRDVRTTEIYAHLQAGYDPDIERAASPGKEPTGMEPKTRRRGLQSRQNGIGASAGWTAAAVALAAMGIGPGCDVPPDATAGQGPAVKAVAATMRAGLADAVTRWETGPLAGGTAVLADGDGAYWVGPDGQVFAANGVAGTWSAGLAWAPRGVDIDTVTAAVRPGP